MKKTHTIILSMIILIMIICFNNLNKDVMMFFMENESMSTLSNLYEKNVPTFYFIFMFLRIFPPLMLGYIFNQVKISVRIVLIILAISLIITSLLFFTMFYNKMLYDNQAIILVVISFITTNILVKKQQ